MAAAALDLSQRVPITVANMQSDSLQSGQSSTVESEKTSSVKRDKSDKQVKREMEVEDSGIGERGICGEESSDDDLETDGCAVAPTRCAVVMSQVGCRSSVSFYCILLCCWLTFSNFAVGHFLLYFVLFEMFKCTDYSRKWYTVVT